ncbi:hypothetical protein BGX28_003396 [Mortierella sp. GBA30]|nr:hypothetical protein BGX28_003396 [Mortierella sp. GBA30]
MASLILPSTASRDCAAQQTHRLIHLLESIDYPYHIPTTDVQAAVLDQYNTLQNSIDAAASHADLPPNTSDLAAPVAKFLDWLLENVSAETNWPGYQRPSKGIVLTGNDNGDLISENDQEDDMDVVLHALDQERSQLHLVSLEQELVELRTLETHALDINKKLDMDIHDTSVTLDATLLKLEETARTVFSEYVTPANSRNTNQEKPHRSVSSGRDGSPFMEVDRNDAEDLALPSSSPSKRFLYQCQDDLLRMQQLDLSFLDIVDQHYKRILKLIDLPSRSRASSATETSPYSISSSSSSHLEQILTRDPDQEQELVRLCSTYRATKMSHIRAMAQLKRLEDELEYMRRLHAQLEEEAKQGGEDRDRTEDFTIGSSKTLQIQKLRQQEIELVSVQRESARLMEEMEQLLSDPVPNFAQDSSRTTGVEADNESVHLGVLVDICERIARSDIELRFLTTAHRDFVRQQEQAMKGLERTIERLLEYYCLGVVVERTLSLEKSVVENQNHVLLAAVEECQEQLDQSRRLRRIADGSQQRQDQSGADNDRQRKQDLGATSRLLDQYAQKNEKHCQELVAMQEHITQMMHVQERLDQELLHQHSSTGQAQLVPKEANVLKDEAVDRARELQQQYTLLSDQVQEIARSKQLHRST